MKRTTLVIIVLVIIAAAIVYWQKDKIKAAVSPGATASASGYFTRPDGSIDYSRKADGSPVMLG